MIHLVELFPDHLNLNGDSGNLLVLEQRIAWSGLTSRRTHLQPGQQPEARPDFLLIGHGSTAAWKQVYGPLVQLAPTIESWLLAGTKVLAISSGFAALHGLVSSLPTSINRGERRSKFVVESFEGHEVFGYINSDLQLPEISRQGNLIGSLIHGPLLAKNSWLADLLIAELALNSARAEINVEKLDQIEKLALAACELAAEQAKD